MSVDLERKAPPAGTKIITAGSAVIIYRENEKKLMVL